MRTAMKLFGVLASLSAFSLMSGVSLAASRPQSPVQIIKTKNVSPQQTHTITKVSTNTLTPAQETSIINAANAFIKYSNKGYAFVSPAKMSKAGLSLTDIHFVQSQISAYNKRIKMGAITPPTKTTMTTSNTSNLLPPLILTTPAASGTGGLPARWFTASTPYVYTANHWWGQSNIFNQLATTKCEGFLWAIAGGMGAGAAASAWLSWAPGGLPATLMLGVLTGGYGAEAGYMEGIDNGYGDHWNSTWTNLPLGWYANTN